MATWTTASGLDPAVSVYQVGSPGTTLAGISAIPSGDTWDAQGNTYNTVGSVVSNGVTITSSTGTGTLNNPGIVITAQAATVGPGPYPTTTGYLTISPAQASLFSSVVGGNIWQLYGGGIHAPVWISSIVTNGDGSLTINVGGTGNGGLRSGFQAGKTYQFYIPFNPIIEVLNNTAPVNISNLGLTGTNPGTNFIDVGAVVNGTGISLKGSTSVTINSVSANGVWGDCFETSNVAGSPALNTGLVVNNFTAGTSGREGMTLVAINGATISNSTINSTLQDALSFESDLPGVGAANVTFVNCAFNGSFNMNGAVNGPILFYSCTNYSSLSTPTGEGFVFFHDAISQYPVTFENCTWVFPTTAGSGAAIQQTGGSLTFANCTFLQSRPGTTAVDPNYSVAVIAPVTKQGDVWSAYSDITTFTGTQSLAMNTYGSLPVSGAGVTIQIAATADTGETGTAIFNYTGVTGSNPTNTALTGVTFVSITTGGVTYTATQVVSSGILWSLAVRASVYWVEPMTGGNLYFYNSPFPTPLSKQGANTVDGNVVAPGTSYAGPYSSVTVGGSIVPELGWSSGVYPRSDNVSYTVGTLVINNSNARAEDVGSPLVGTDLPTGATVASVVAGTSQTITTPLTLTLGSGYSNTDISTIATWSHPEPGVLNIAGTADNEPLNQIDGLAYGTGGVVRVATTTGTAIVLYTSTTGYGPTAVVTLNGCTLLSHTGTTLINSGGAVTPAIGATSTSSNVVTAPVYPLATSSVRDFDMIEVSTPNMLNIFETSSLPLTLTSSEFHLSGSGATNWEISDIAENVIATGTVSGTTLNGLPNITAYGWYRLRLLGNLNTSTTFGAYFGNAFGSCMFHVVPSDSNYPAVGGTNTSYPYWNGSQTVGGGFPTANTGPAGQGVNPGMHGQFDVGPIRLSFQPPGTTWLSIAEGYGPAATSGTFLHDDVSYGWTSIATDSARPTRTHFAEFPYWAAAAADVSGLTAVVGQLSTGVVYEGFNEPNEAVGLIGVAGNTAAITGISFTPGGTTVTFTCNLGSLGSPTLNAGGGDVVWIKGVTGTSNVPSLVNSVPGLTTTAASSTSFTVTVASATTSGTATGGNAWSGFFAVSESFYQTVHNANNSCKVIGPAQVTINEQSLPWLQSFFALQPRLDGISFHPYNSFAGDLWLGDQTMQAYLAILGAHTNPVTSQPYSSLPIWCSENGGDFMADYGPAFFRRQMRDSISRMIQQDTYGVAKERQSYFYDTSNGFWSQPSWLQNQGAFEGNINGTGWQYDGQPLLSAMRQFSRMVRGKTYASTLGLGAAADYVRGYLYANTGSTAFTLVFLTTGTASMPVTVYSSGTMTVYDVFGNTITTGTGNLTVTATELPMYIESTASIAVTDVGGGLIQALNIAPRAVPSVTSTSGTPAQFLVPRISDGLQYSEYLAPSSPSPTYEPYMDTDWSQSQGGVFPTIATVTWQPSVSTTTVAAKWCTTLSDIANVAGSGNTITNSGGTTTLTIDGGTPALNDIVLVTNQSRDYVGECNGVYKLTTVGASGVNWVLTRLSTPTLANYPGMYVTVSNGATNANTIWYCANVNTPMAYNATITPTSVTTVASFMATMTFAGGLPSGLIDWGYVSQNPVQMYLTGPGIASYCFISGVNTTTNTVTLVGPSGSFSGLTTSTFTCSGTPLVFVPVGSIPTPQTTIPVIDRVGVFFAPPWQTGTAPISFSLQALEGATWSGSAWTGGTWTTIETYTNATATSIPFADPGPGTTYETFYNGEWVVYMTFAPVATPALRINVTATTYGDCPDSNTYNQTAGNQGSPQHLTLRDFRAYAAPNSGFLSVLV